MKKVIDFPCRRCGRTLQAQPGAKRRCKTCGTRNTAPASIVPDSLPLLPPDKVNPPDALALLSAGVPSPQMIVSFRCGRCHRRLDAPPDQFKCCDCGYLNPPRKPEPPARTSESRPQPALPAETHEVSVLCDRCLKVFPAPPGSKACCPDCGGSYPTPKETEVNQQLLSQPTWEETVAAAPRKVPRPEHSRRSVGWRSQVYVFKCPYCAAKISSPEPPGGTARCPACLGWRHVPSDAQPDPTLFEWKMLPLGDWVAGGIVGLGLVGLLFAAWWLFWPSPRPFDPSTKYDRAIEEYNRVKRLMDKPLDQLTDKEIDEVSRRIADEYERQRRKP
jgi:hypothetical protein